LQLTANESETSTQFCTLLKMMLMFCRAYEALLYCLHDSVGCKAGMGMRHKSSRLRRDRDICLRRPRHWQFFSKPRRDVGTSWDRDAKTESTTLLQWHIFTYLHTVVYCQHCASVFPCVLCSSV